MKLIITLFLSLFFLSTTFGQDNSLKKKPGFSSINQVGILVGARGESALVQSINGIKKDKWFAGFGAGIDFYIERGVPLFIDIRRDLINGRNPLFLYADIGMYFPWLNFIQKEQKLHSKISPGGFYDIGVGWQLKGKNNRSFLLSAGYGCKQVYEKATFQSWNPTITGLTNTSETYNYQYRRLVLKVGVQL